MSTSVQPGVSSPPSEIYAEQYVGRRVASSAAWMVLLRIAFKFIGVFSSLFLVRALTPEVFGLVGLATVAFSVFDAMTEFSFVLALVKMKDPQRAHFDTAWTLVVMRGFLIGALMFFSAPLVADFMHDPRLFNVIRVFALWPILAGLENVGLIQFKRELRFERIFWYQLLDKMIGTLLVIPAALILHNVWALVIGTFFGKFITVPVSYLIHPYRPRFSLKAANELMNFSKWLFATNILSLINNYMMTFVLGRVGGASSVGFYNVAYQIGSLPASEVAAPIRAPMYSGLAKITDDRARMCQQVIDGLALTLMLIAPMSIGIALCSSLIVPVGLGGQWLEAVPLIKILALYAMFEVIGEYTHNIYIVTDRQRRFVTIMAGTLAVRTILVIWAGVTYGLNGAAIVLAVTGFLNSAIWFAQLPGMIGLSLKRTAAAIWRTVVATLVMSAGVYYLQIVWPQSPLTSVMTLQLIANGVVGATIYLAALLGLWHFCGQPAGPENYAIKAIGYIGRRIAAWVKPRRNAMSAAK